mmetsp:Transcript_12334/g.26633  ORF Transcript_12334/g.26633 Transcript_12334/m.26633 type:complete len:514 (+) Transcript_12334:286-1827(+)|eukprot:CAMPEP_0202915722 /NCGR_PEP_ID=MMETSP1392-20130828/66471_1 /ASSEMBLY_ACC=CAM_ASM_000868 /TAXON_ID=225041 /ORGANISM="Chlamydomonas chlamydogama, Strain SAG 11-48b" /LENGTH=513 /DNA_ID=CAMNT_0049607867 /DNA_START=254 /DNA_END=1795 /DNA_ORIENTATION=+
MARSSTAAAMHRHPLLLCALFFLAAAFLPTRLHANPGLWSAVRRDPAKFIMVMQGFAADSIYINSSDVGVQHCNFSFLAANPQYPYSPKEILVRLHVFMKYLHWQGQVTIKGFLVADTRDISKINTEYVLQPLFTMRFLGEKGQRRTHVFKSRVTVHSYWDPPSQAAMVYGFETGFDLGENWQQAKHEYDLNVDLDPRTCSFKPDSNLNLIDGRGVDIAPVKPGADIPRETFVVLRPLYNFTPSVFGPLVQRHVEYYQSLGVSKHIIYLRKEMIPALLLMNAQVARLVAKGKIIIILWDELPQHEIWTRKYDQRVVYSHALLAFTGLDVYLMFVDLDEYLVTPRTDLQMQPIQQIFKTCAGHPAEMRVMRYNTLCKNCNHAAPEAHLWVNPFRPDHPLNTYSLINYVMTPAARSIVNPNFMRNFYIHWGSVAAGYNTTYPPGKCMFFLHVAHLLRASTRPEKISAQFVEDRSWMGTLKRVMNVEPPIQLDNYTTPNRPPWNFKPPPPFDRAIT